MRMKSLKVRDGKKNSIRGNVFTWVLLIAWVLVIVLKLFYLLTGS